MNKTTIFSWTLYKNQKGKQLLQSPHTNTVLFNLLSVGNFLDLVGLILAPPLDKVERFISWLIILLVSKKQFSSLFQISYAGDTLDLCPFHLRWTPGVMRPKSSSARSCWAVKTSNLLIPDLASLIMQVCCCLTSNRQSSVHKHCFILKVCIVSGMFLPVLLDLPSANWCVEVLHL